MSVYMVRYTLSSANRNSAINRFMTNEAALTPPEGVTSLARWHSVEGNGGWNIVDAPDPKSIADWVLHWSDVMSYDVTPVVSDEELGELFQKHGLG